MIQHNVVYVTDEDTTIHVSCECGWSYASGVAPADEDGVVTEIIGVIHHGEIHRTFYETLTIDEAELL